MSLEKILEDCGIRSSRSFKQDIKKLDGELKRISSRKSSHQLFLINDDQNKIQDVISALIVSCDISIEEATAIALVTHERGKCLIVGLNDKNALKKIAIMLAAHGLNVTIESGE